MKPVPEQNPFVVLRAAVADCLRTMAGNVGEVEVRGVDILLEGETIPIRFAAGLRLDDVERVIVEVIRQAGKPLQQKEIAEIADIGKRTVERTTPGLVSRGVLLKHPTLGLYVAGMRFEDFPP